MARLNIIDDPRRVYPCGFHFHFEPHKRKKPWYKEEKFCDDDHGDFPPGQEVYVRGSSSNDGPLKIKCMLEADFYILRKGNDVQQCMGRHGRLEDQLWIKENLSLQPWWDSASGPPPPYDSAGSAADPPGYGRE